MGDKMQALQFKLHPDHVKAFRNLSIFPVSIDQENILKYDTLDDALETGEMEVAEISETGSVPSLQVRNNTDHDVLVIEGEELLGAKQNRIVNTSILVKKKSETLIPVSCVEQGRWDYTSRNLGPSGSLGYSGLRQMMSEQVTESLRTRGDHESDQSTIWMEVERKLSSLSSESPTTEMHRVYLDHEDVLQEYSEHLPPPDAGSGVVVAINGKVSCLDIFDKPETLKKLWVKLLSSYIMEAIEVYTTDFPPTQEIEVMEILDSVTNADKEVFESVALGEDIRFQTETLVGAALVHEEKTVHLSAFMRTTE
jgi:hypothetical protein